MSNRYSAVKKKKGSFSFSEQVERRLDRAETKGRWLWYLQVVLFVILLVLVVVAVLNARNPQNFPIRHVKVEASFKHIEPNDLEKVVAPYIKKSGFFSLASSELRDSILNLPWAYKVSINRVWPDKIIIKVNEQKPIALFNGSSLINAKGKLFTPKAKTIPLGLPKLLGPSDQVLPMVGDYIAINKLLVPFGWTISLFDNSDSLRGWHIVLSNGMEIFANGDNAVPELQNFLNLYKGIEAKNAGKVAKVVDLRYQDGFAVKWVKVVEN